jgi:hypothetical protein
VREIERDMTWTQLNEQGASYVYRVHLAPFFQEHERDIDLFLASLRTRAGSAFVDGLTWLWAIVRTQLNVRRPHPLRKRTVLILTL